MNTEAWRRYLRFWRADVEDDVDEELRFHIEMQEGEYVAAGLASDDAHTEALRRFGSLASVRDLCYRIGHQRERHVRFAEVMYSVRNDIVFASRQLARNRGFTMAAVLTLALGIGANGLVFGLVNALLLHPLPGVAAPERVVAVNNTHVSYPSYRDFARSSSALSGLAAFSDRNTAVSDGKRTEMVSAAVVSGNYFSVLGVGPSHGRVLSPGDDDPGAPPIAVVSAAFARRFFRDGVDVIGRVVDLNGMPVTIVGIAANDFHGMQLDSPEELWVTIRAWMALAPTSFNGLNLEGRGWSWLSMVGRLAPDATIQQATAALHTSAVNQDASYPDGYQTLAKTITSDNVVSAGQGRDLRNRTWNCRTRHGDSGCGGCNRASHSVRQRLQPAPCTGDEPAPRNRDSHGSGRWTTPPGPAVTDRKRCARARCLSRWPGGDASRDARTVTRNAARRILVRHGRR